MCALFQAITNTIKSSTKVSQMSFLQTNPMLEIQAISKYRNRKQVSDVIKTEANGTDNNSYVCSFGNCSPHRNKCGHIAITFAHFFLVLILILNFISVFVRFVYFVLCCAYASDYGIFGVRAIARLLGYSMFTDILLCVTLNKMHVNITWWTSSVSCR